jgi:transcriptional regulator with XRE-family HTH domain
MSYIEPYVLTQNRTLKTERKRRGWTQARLAKVMGVSTRTVMRWEHGLGLPHPGHRVQLETLFGRTAEQLGIWEDTDENEAVDLMLTTLPHASPHVASQEAMSEVSVPESLQIDPVIPQPMGSSGCLLGRAGLLMQVKDHLLGADRLPFTALYGLPGIGKTTLAAALATDQQVQAHFRDGILWAPLGPQPHVLGQLIRWGMQLRITHSNVENPESPQAWSKALRSALGTRQMLLIIDDAWTVEDAQTLLVGGPQCTYLLTTRQIQVALAFAQQQSILVPQLEAADGLALLTRYIPQVIQQDPQGAQSLVQVLDCLPLALTIMGKSLALLALTQHPSPLQETLVQLHNTQRHLRLNMLTASKQSCSKLTQMAPLSLYATIVICAQRLRQEAQATLSALTIFPPKPYSFSEEAALVVSQQSRETLDELCEAGLLECWGPEC